MSALQLELGSPQDGWLDVALSGSGGSVEHDVSDVPGDSLQMLAVAASNAMKGIGGGEVTWFLEPAEVRWFFRPTAEGLGIWVQGDRKKEQCIAVGSTEAICAGVWEAMRKAGEDPAWIGAGDGRVWSHPFPYPEVEALGDELRQRGIVKGAR